MAESSTGTVGATSTATRSPTTIESPGGLQTGGINLTRNQDRGLLGYRGRVPFTQPREVTELSADTHNWKRGMERRGLPTKEAERLVEMDLGVQADVCRVIFERYKTMVRYTAPRPGEQKPPGVQMFDRMAEQAIKVIFHENYRDEVMFNADGSPKNVHDVIEEMDRHISSMRLDVLNQSTRDLAFRVLEGTEIEMMAAAAVANKSQPRAAEGLGQGVGQRVSTLLRDRVANSDKLLRVISYLTPGVPHSGPDYEAWKVYMKGRNITPFDPTSVAYESAYMIESNFAAQGQTHRMAEIYRLDDLRKQYLTAATGIDVTHSLLADLVDVTVGDVRADRMAGNVYKKLKFVQQLDRVMADMHPDVKSFDALPLEERTPVILQAIRQAAEHEASEHIDAILKNTAGTTFTELDLDAAQKKIETKIEGGKPVSGEAAELESRIQKVESTYNDFTRAKEEKSRADRAGQTVVQKELERTLAEGERVSRQTQIENLTTIVNPLPPPPRISRVAPLTTTESKQLTEATKNLEAIAIRIQSLEGDITKLRVDMDTAEKNIETVRAAIQSAITGYATTTELHAIIPSAAPGYAGPPGITVLSEGELAKFIRLQRAKEAEMLDKAGRNRELGEKVLKLFKPGANGELPINSVISAFATEHGVNLTGPNGIQTPEKFIEFLGLDQKVLPPERLAKLLVVYLELKLDPNAIPAPDPAKPSDVARFRTLWTDIYKSFCRKDGGARASAVLNIYHDRFMAIKTKGDPTADYLAYEVPRPVDELIRKEVRGGEVKVASEKGLERLDLLASKSGIIAGVNATAVELAGRVIVGDTGEMRILKPEMSYDAAITRKHTVEFEDLGNMGITLDVAANRVVITNPGSPSLRRERNKILRRDRTIVSEGLEMLFAGRPVGHVENITCPDGNVRQLQLVAPNNIQITGGPEFVAGGGININLAAFVGMYRGENYLDLEGAGRWMVENVMRRSNNLAEGAEVAKGTGFKEITIDPVVVQRELHWADPDRDDVEFAVILNDASDIFIERRQRDAAGQWVATPTLVPGLGRNRLALDEFIALTNAQDTRGLRRKIPAAAFDLLAKMSPAERSSVGLDNTAIDLTVEAEGISGSVTAAINNKGEMVVNFPDGSSRNLLELLNTAATTNTVVRYDRLNPNVLAQVMANPNLRIQTEVGRALFEALHNKNIA